MSEPRRGLVAALLVGACVALAGCWEKESGPNEPAFETDPLTVRKQVVSQERARALQNHHDRTVEAFVKTEGYGVYRMPTLTHAVKPSSLAINLPGWAEGPSPDATGAPPPVTLSPWVMDKVELVSLLVNDQPGVYPATGMGLGRKRAKTRDLDEFERDALERLRNGEQIQVKESPDDVRVLGAVRMRKECQSCHDKPEGTLLGAFTYSFKPGAAKPAPNK